MTEKLLVLIFYALIGIIVGLWPSFTRSAKVVPPVLLAASSVTSGIATAGYFFLCIFSAWLVGFDAAPITTVVFLIVSLGSGLGQKQISLIHALSSFAGIVLASTLPWWRRELPPSLDLRPSELIAFGLLMLCTIRILNSSNLAITARGKPQLIQAIQVGAFLALAALLSFTTGIFQNFQAVTAAWHHWGAYIGPAELVLAGARIFVDFPAQYGFGPTILIAATCGSDCWTSMYYVVGTITFIFALLIALLALSIEKVSNLQRIAVLTLCLVCCFMWNAFPPSLGLPTFMPSVGGLRFLPVVAFVYFLAAMDRRITLNPRLMRWGHTIWAVAVVWAPESAFCASFVWAPYYLFYCVMNKREQQSRSYAFVKGIATLCTLTVLLIFLFAGFYWLVYDQFPQLHVYAAYILNPPGPLPIKPHGAIWFFIAVMLVGIMALWNRYKSNGNTQKFRLGFLLVLQAYAVFSYFLGRSHDNNVLNLLPFLLLVLLHARATFDIDNKWRTLTVAMLSTLIGWTSVFGWTIFTEAIAPAKLFKFGSANVASRLSYQNENTLRDFSAYRVGGGNRKDAAIAMEYITRNFHEPVTLLDSSLHLASQDPKAVWNAIHGPANFVFIPSQRRREFLQKTADRLRLNGWVVAEKSFPLGDWLADFNSVYTQADVLDFGSYFAIRYLYRSPLNSQDLRR